MPCYQTCIWVEITMKNVATEFDILNYYMQSNT